MRWFLRIGSLALLALMAGLTGWRLSQEGLGSRLLDPAGWGEARRERDLMRHLQDTLGEVPQLRRSEDLTRSKIDRVLNEKDPYSDYLSKEEFEDFEKETSQEYVGVGVQIATVEGETVVTRVFEDSPALEGGLLPGDRIRRVDGRNTAGLTVGEVVKGISGRAGTEVVLEVARPKEEALLRFALVGREIHLASVVEVRLEEEGGGYLRIAEFGKRTGAEFLAALVELERQGMEALIIDVRNNPGGMLDAAVEVVEPFFRRGETVVEIKGIGKQRDETMKAWPTRRPRQFPVAVLVNRGSASASEIVAGALQKTGRAILVGDRTYGKGSVQSVFALRNGEGLRMTTAHYLLPDGSRIEEGRGLKPDVVVALDRDTAQRLRLQQFHGSALSAEAFVDEFGFQPTGDPQIKAAVEALRERMAAADL